MFLERFVNAIKDEVGECRCEDEACCSDGGSGCYDGGHDEAAFEGGSAENGGGGGDKSAGCGIARTGGEENDNLREEGEQDAADGPIEEQRETIQAKGEKTNDDEDEGKREEEGDGGDECLGVEECREEDDQENAEEGPVQLPSIQHERQDDEPDKNANCCHEVEEKALPRSGYGPTTTTIRKYIEDANFQFVPRSRRRSGRVSGGGKGASTKCDDVDNDQSQWQNFYFE
ncbi:MAG: hypothetical protein VX367_09960 [SAR324 cluster bacterium]|nr:hypothetical protein [SAR324 cluster bacterium]